MRPTWGCLTTFSITISAEGDVQVVRLAGELDILGAEDVRAALVGAAGSTVVADLSGLSLIDARGVSAVVEAGDEIRAGGNQLRIVGATGLVRQVFEICGLDGRLE